MAEQMNDVSSLQRTFPIKPKLKPKTLSSKQTPESKYWSFFKTQQIPNLISSIFSLSFSPTSPVFSATHFASLTFFSSQTLSQLHTISLPDVATSASFRSDGLLLAAADLTGLIQVFDVKTRNPLRKLRSHAGPCRFIKYPVSEKLHLWSGGDDTIVKYWDVPGETVISDLVGHADYVRCGDASPVSAEMLVSGCYDHTVKVWDTRTGKCSMEINHGSPVEDVIFLPSGSLIASAGANSVKIWDVIGGGKMICSMESHNKTVTSLCMGKMIKEMGEESMEDRILSVGLDGYMKVFDHTKKKVTHSMRFPTSLMSIAFSPSHAIRAIGTSNGVIYVSKKKTKEHDNVEERANGHPKPISRHSSFRYFNRGQGEKPSEDDYLVSRRKTTKMAEHDKLLVKFKHHDAFVSVLNEKNPESVVAVMEELVARRKLLRCVLNLERNELVLLLEFLQKHMIQPRYANLLMNLLNKIIEMRGEDVKASDDMMRIVRNIKRSIDEEIRLQKSLQEIQGIVSPLLRIARR